MTYVTPYVATVEVMDEQGERIGFGLPVEVHRFHLVTDGDGIHLDVTCPEENRGNIGCTVLDPHSSECCTNGRDECWVQARVNQTLDDLFAEHRREVAVIVTDEGWVIT